jgi:anti-sigma factor RsiW
LPEVKAGRRKAFSPLSRNFQFAALSPAKAGGVRLGLALTPDASPRLQPPKRESWSERLKSVVVLASVEAVDGEIEALLRQAWEGS